MYQMAPKRTDFFFLFIHLTKYQGWPKSAGNKKVFKKKYQNVAPSPESGV